MQSFHKKKTLLFFMHVIDVHLHDGPEFAQADTGHQMY